MPAGRVLEIKQAQAAERAAALGILLNAAGRQAALGLEAWSEASLAAAIDIALPKGELFIAWLNGEPAGAVILQWSDPAFWGEQPDDAGYVHKLAVGEAYAGYGVGSAVLAWAEAQVRGRGRPYVRLDCQAENPRINRYYREAGFVRRSERIVIDGWSAHLYEKLVDDST